MSNKAAYHLTAGIFALVTAIFAYATAATKHDGMQFGIVICAVLCLGYMLAGAKSDRRE